MPHFPDGFPRAFSDAEFTDRRRSGRASVSSNVAVPFFKDDPPHVDVAQQRRPPIHLGQARTLGRLSKAVLSCPAIVRSDTGLPLGPT